MAARNPYAAERLFELNSVYWAAACLSEASSAAQEKNARGLQGVRAPAPPTKSFAPKAAFNITSNTSKSFHRRPSFRPRRGRNLAAQNPDAAEQLFELNSVYWAAACLSEASSAAQEKNARGLQGVRARTPYKKFCSKKDHRRGTIFCRLFKCRRDACIPSIALIHC